jgi:hypothetical protein
MSAKVEDLFADLIKATGEPLHSDLLPYLEDGVLGKQLRHPLVYQVPLWANGHANAYYLQKKKAVAEALENKNYNSYVYLHERPYRLQAFIQIADKLSDTKYWTLLSSIWIDTENQWQNHEIWKTLLSSKRSSRHYLSGEEGDNLLRSLPEEVTIYRGCQPGLNENGLSWTLDKNKAKFFANRFGEEGIILEKKIFKTKIIAVLLGRGESEVIYEGVIK